MIFLSYVLLHLLFPQFNRARFLVFEEVSVGFTGWQDRVSGKQLNICQRSPTEYYVGQQSQTHIYWEKSHTLPQSNSLDIYMEFKVSGIWQNQKLEIYANKILVKVIMINLNDSNRLCTQNFLYESFAYIKFVKNIDVLTLTLKSYGINQGLYIQNLIINQRTQYGRNILIPFFYDIKMCTTGLQFQQYYCQCISKKVFQTNSCLSACGQGYLYDPSTNECYEKQNCDQCVGVNQILKCNPGTFKYQEQNVQESNCLTRCPNDYYEDSTTMTCLEMQVYLQQNMNKGYPVEHYFFHKNTADFFHFFQNSFKQKIQSKPAKVVERSFAYHNGKFVAGSLETFQSQRIQLAILAKMSQHKLLFRAIGHFIDFLPTRNNVYINDVLQPQSLLKLSTENEAKSDQDYIVYYDYIWTRTELYPVGFNNIIFDIEQPSQKGVYQGCFYLEDIHIFQFQCITNCNSCYTVDYCTPCLNPANKNPRDCSCLSGFRLKDDQCIACPTYCSYCTVPGVCDSCQASTKRLNPPSCNTCPEQYHIQVDQDNCQQCILGCRICTSQNFCINCLSGYYKSSDSQCLISCPTGYYNDNTDSNNPLCSLCSNNCLKCENISTYCTACGAPASLINNHCYSCNTGYYLSGITCRSCISNCEKCQDATCQMCKETYFKTRTGSCAAICEQNYYGNVLTRTCVKCNSTCITCISGTANDCLSCPVGKLLNLKTSVSGSCQINCLIGYFRTEDFCAKCWKGCASCKDASPACLSCGRNYYRHKPNQFCYEQCPDGFYNNRKGYVCSACNPLCNTCNGSAQTNCTSCLLPLALYQNKCLTTCPLRYGNVNGVCLLCTPNCKQCFGTQPNQCSLCSQGFYFLKNQCYLQCPTSFVGIRPQYICECIYDNCVACTSVEFFYNNHCYDKCPEGSFGFNGLCVKCDIFCGTCFGEDDNSCLSCTSPLILFQNSCVTECVGTTFHDILKNECLYCHDSCLACNGSNDNNCTACYESKLITEDGSCVDQCSDNEYPVLSEKKCLKCDLSCLTCFGGSKNSCLTCSNLFYLYQCVDSCPDGFQIGTNLISCEPNFAIVIDQCAYQCKTCELVPRFCKTCSGNRVPNPPYCDCENGYYDDGQNSDCQQCDNKCATCSIHYNSCITCKGDRQLPKCTCPKYYYDDYYSVHCIRCPVNCATCNQFGCIKCLNNRINSPDCLCPNGYYEAYVPYCLECAKKCQACSVSDKLCETCSDIRENPPICNCPGGYFENSNEDCQKCNPSCIDCNINGCLTCFGNRVGPFDGLCQCANPGVSRLNVGSLFCTDCSLGVPFFGLNEDFTGFHFEFGLQVSFFLTEENQDICSQFFTLQTLQTLGKNPKCDMQLNVLFGENATIKLGDSLQLMPQFLLLGCQKQFTKILAMPISIPSSINQATHLPLIKFKELGQPNICTPISIKFEKIFYNWNQQLEILDWVMVLPVQSDPNIETILQNAVTLNSQVIEFPIRTFQAGLQYKFKVTVRSLANLINTLTIQFIPVAFSTVLFEPNLKSDQFQRFDTIRIPFTLSYYNCKEQNPPSQQLFYTIVLQNTNNVLLSGFFEGEFIDGYKKDIELQISSYYFNFTNPYTLVYSTTLQHSDYKVETSGSVDIFIVSSAPVLTIEGGNRMIGYDTNLYLNATIKDQDFTQVEASQMHYTCYWECIEIVNGTNCLDQFNQIIVFDNNCQQLIKGKTFAPYSIFFVSVSILKNMIPYSSKISLQVMELGLPTLNVIGIDQSEIINYYDELIYQLIYPGINPDFLMYAGAVIYDQKIQATFQFYYLKLKFKLLNYFTELGFSNEVKLRLSVYDPRFIVPSLNTQILTMNIPPQNCRLQFDNNNFIEFLDTIGLVVEECKDENLPLFYSVQFYPNYTIYESDLLESNFYNYILIEPPQYNNMFSFSLPYLNNATSYLVVIIQDSNGGISNITAQINVKQFENIDENTLKNYQKKQISLNQQIIGYRVVAERLSYIKNMQEFKQDLFAELIQFDQNHTFLSNETECLYHSISIMAGQNSSILQVNEKTLNTQLNYRISIASQALQNLNYYQKNNIMTSSQNLEKIFNIQQFYSFANILSSFIKYRVGFNKSTEDIQDQLNILITKLQEISLANEPLYKIKTDSANLNFGYLTSKLTESLTGAYFFDSNTINQNNSIDFNSSTNFYRYSLIRYLDNPYYTSDGFPKNSSGYQAVDPKIETNNTSNLTLAIPVKFQFPNNKSLAVNTSLECIVQVNSTKWNVDVCKTIKNKENIICECNSLNPTSIMESLDYILDKGQQIYSLDTLLAFASFPFYKTLVFYFYLFITGSYLGIIYWGMKVDNKMFQKIQDLNIMEEELKDKYHENFQENDRVGKLKQSNIFTRTVFRHQSLKVMKFFKLDKYQKIATITDTNQQGPNSPGNSKQINSITYINSGQPPIQVQFPSSPQILNDDFPLIKLQQNSDQQSECKTESENSLKKVENLKLSKMGAFFEYFKFFHQILSILYKDDEEKPRALRGTILYTSIMGSLTVLFVFNQPNNLSFTIALALVTAPLNKIYQILLEKLLTNKRKTVRQLGGIIMITVACFISYTMLAGLVLNASIETANQWSYIFIGTFTLDNMIYSPIQLALQYSVHIDIIPISIVKTLLFKLLDEKSKEFLRQICSKLG